MGETLQSYEGEWYEKKNANIVRHTDIGFFDSDCVLVCVRACHLFYFWSFIDCFYSSRFPMYALCVYAQYPIQRERERKRSYTLIIYYNLRLDKNPMNCMDLLLQMATCFSIFTKSKIGCSVLKKWPKERKRRYCKREGERWMERGWKEADKTQCRPKAPQAIRRHFDKNRSW